MEALVKVTSARKTREGGNNSPASAKPPAGITNAQAAIVVLIGIAFSLGVIFEWEPLNGVKTWAHWEWPWRDLGVFETGMWMLPSILAIGWVLWRVEKRASPQPWQLLPLLVLSNYALQVLGMLADPRGIKFVGTIVASAGATSYFTDAIAIQGSLANWLRHFHQTQLHWHSTTHPAGPIVFYYSFLKLFGGDAGALVGGCCVGLMASAGVLVVFRFARLWTDNHKARIAAAALYALVPALTVFFPEFDQAYPILSMLLILLWVEALESAENRVPRAVALGLVLFVSTLFAYNLLSIGAFLLYYGCYWMRKNRCARSGWYTVVGVGCVSAITFVGCHLLLWLTTGYNAVAAFHNALHNQAHIAKILNRPYSVFVLLDPYDFLLGAGVLVLPLVVFYGCNRLRSSDVDRAGSALLWISLATIATVDLSGLLRAESARAWLFLQPLLVVPAALELSRANLSWRLSIFAIQWWIVVCLKAKMTFIGV